jgi:hypothetical protein
MDGDPLGGLHLYLIMLIFCSVNNEIVLSEKNIYIPKDYFIVYPVLRHRVQFF